MTMLIILFLILLFSAWVAVEVRMRGYVEFFARSKLLLALVSVALSVFLFLCGWLIFGLFDSYFDAQLKLLNPQHATGWGRVVWFVNSLILFILLPWIYIVVELIGSRRKYTYNIKSIIVSVSVLLIFSFLIIASTGFDISMVLFSNDQSDVIERYSVFSLVALNFFIAFVYSFLMNSLPEHFGKSSS